MRKLAYLLLTAMPAFSATVDFERDVKPIFRENCWECHGRTQQNGRLRLDQKGSALLGSGGRSDILPGHPETSTVYKRIMGKEKPQMPPETPLTAEQIATIKLWIEQGAPWPDNDGAEDRTWKPDPRVGPLTEQIRKGNFGAVRAAVTAGPELAQARDDSGHTLLLQAALYSTAADVKFLLSQKADPNGADVFGKTPLMLAIEDAEKVHVLLEGGADPNAHTESGHTALSLAVDQRRAAPVVRELLEHGAKSGPEKGEGDPLVQVARNGDIESMKLLVAKRGDQYPPAAVNAAAASNCMACLQLVLSQMPPKRAINDAFLAASLMSNSDILNALLAAGADPNASADKKGHTALMQAAYSDFAEPSRIKLLLDHGADVNARGKDGETALKQARRKGETKIAEMLIAAGEKE
jgi:ankyrin repeat protein